MTFSIDNPRGVATTPLGKYVWEKPLGEQGLNESLNYQYVTLLRNYSITFSQPVILMLMTLVNYY